MSLMPAGGIEEYDTELPFPDDISETCAAAKDVAVCSHGTTMTRKGCFNAELKQQGGMFRSVCCGIALAALGRRSFGCVRGRVGSTEILLLRCCYVVWEFATQPLVRSRSKKGVFRPISKIFVHMYA